MKPNLQYALVVGVWLIVISNLFPRQVKVLNSAKEVTDVKTGEMEANFTGLGNHILDVDENGRLEVYIPQKQAFVPVTIEVIQHDTRVRK